MKKLIIPAFIAAITFTACSPTSDTGGQQLKSNGQSFDSTPNVGTNNEQMTRTPSNAGGPVNGNDTLQDSINAAK